MRGIRRTTFFLYFCSAQFAAAPPSFAADGFAAYLFVYFIGNDNSKHQESIFFAVSDDGHSFKALNKKNPIISSAQISASGGVRDPHILRGENNDYFMVATDMVSANGWASNRGIVLLKSTDLIEWKSSAINITTAFTEYKSADRVWAPQTIYDRSVGKYMIYFAMRLGPSDFDKIYYAYADSTFTKLETAPELLYAYGTVAAIDADIIYKDSTYHLFFKTEGSNQKGIKSATSTTLTGTYTLFDKYLQATAAAVEGSCVFKLIDSDTFVLMYDVYTSGRYEFAVSTDLKNFTKDPKPLSFDFTPRHGTVIPITASEKRALLAEWDPTGVAHDPAVNRPAVAYSRAGTMLQIMFGENPGRGSVDLFDLAGKKILRRTVYAKSTIIDLKTLPAGVYYIFCKAAGGVARGTALPVQ